MIAFLKNHPFAVDAFFEHSIVLTFAVKKERLAGLLPPCLELDIFNDEWAFIAAAFVKTKSLRPKGFHRLLGNDFVLAGYRIFVKYHTNSGKRYRGLYILKSETNRLKMQLLGNVFTHYNYSTTDIFIVDFNGKFSVVSKKSGVNVQGASELDEIELPNNSPFTNWKEARRYAGPLPFTFTFNKAKSEVLIIEGVRESWVPKPINIDSYQIEYLTELGLQDVVLASAFEVKNIPYTWKKGRIEKWQG